MGDAKRALRNHSRLVRISDGGGDVTYIVQSAESTRDVRTLRFLYFIKQFAHIGGHRAHAQTVQRTVQHMCLDAGFVERFRPLAHSLIGILAEQKIYLFKTAAIRFYTGKTSHLDNGGSYLYQLVYTGNILSGALPHIPEYQTELNFFFHTKLFLCVFI